MAPKSNPYPASESIQKMVAMAVVPATTKEQGQHQPDAVTGEDDDGSDGSSSKWSRKCSKSTSDDVEVAHDSASGVERSENDIPVTDEPYHEVAQGHRAGDAELVAESCPAGTEVLQYDPNAELSLSFGSTQPEELPATDAAEPDELTPDGQPVPRPESESGGGKKRKRKASEELAGCKRKS